MIFIDHEEYGGEPDDSRLTRIIKYALSHHTKHLTIYLENGGIEGLYHFSALFGLISDCDLKSLVLRDFTIDTGFQSSGFGFRVLTRLELIACLVSENLGEVIDPFSKFTCLRTLDLNYFSASGSGDEKVFRISGLQLISLNIYDSQFDKLEVYAPKLKYFTIVDHGEISEFSKFTLPSLEYADIWVEFVDDRYDHEYVSRHMISLLQGLNNVMSLRLKCFTVEVLNTIADYFEEQPSPFTRLKSLIVGADRLPLVLINYFLQGSSTLKPVVKFE